MTALVNRVVSKKDEVLDNHHNCDVNQTDNTKDATIGGKERKGTSESVQVKALCVCTHTHTHTPCIAECPNVLKHEHGEYEEGGQNRHGELAAHVPLVTQIDHLTGVARCDVKLEVSSNCERQEDAL